MVKGIKKMDIAENTEILNLKEREKGEVPFRIQKIQNDSGNERDPGYPAARDAGMTVEDINRRMENFAEKLEKAVIKVSAQDGGETGHAVAAANPKDLAKELIKVKFEKFVQLVATRNFVDVLERNKHEDIIMSSNLLTDLAGAVEEKSEKKTPVIFLVGLAIGIALTYLLLNR